MKKILMLMCYLAATISFDEKLKAQDEKHLLFHNSLGEEMEMWLFIREPRGWNSPVTRIDIEETRNVKFQHQSPYYVVLVDTNFNKDRLGWFDFYRQANQEPGKQIELRALYNTSTEVRKETRTRSVQVTKQVAEERQRTYKVVNPRTGKTEDRTANYTVMVPRAEIVEQKYTVSVPVLTTTRNLQLQVTSDDGRRSALSPINLNEIPPFPGADQVGTLQRGNEPTPRLGITFHICPSGIHILSVANGSPATECRETSTGNKVILKVGDHLIGVDGREPKSEAEMQQLIARAGKSVALTLLDVKTGKTLELTTELETE